MVYVLVVPSVLPRPHISISFHRTPLYCLHFTRRRKSTIVQPPEDSLTLHSVALFHAFEYTVPDCGIPSYPEYVCYNGLRSFGPFGAGNARAVLASKISNACLDKFAEEHKISSMVKGTTPEPTEALLSEGLCKLPRIRTLTLETYAVTGSDDIRNAFTVLNLNSSAGIDNPRHCRISYFFTKIARYKGMHYSYEATEMKSLMFYSRIQPHSFTLWDRS